MHRGIMELLQEIRGMGFSIKIDTNGSRPAVLKKLIEEQLIDFLALDFKALPDKYRLLTGSDLFSEFEQSLLLLLKSGLPFEVRTTVHSELLTQNDLIKMSDYLYRIGYNGTYYLQNYVNDLPTLAPLPPSSRIKSIKEITRPDLQIVLRA